MIFAENRFPLFGIMLYSAAPAKCPVSNQGGSPVATTRPLSEILPKEMTELRMRPLFTLLLDVAPPIVVGKAPGVDRRVGVITGGRFEGERLRGTLFPGGGSDWQSVRPGDGAWMINVRIVLKTDDDAIIAMPYTGIRHGPKEVIDRLNRGEAIEPSTYYFRATPYFETSSEKYNWLNRICSIAAGSRAARGRTFEVFQVL